MEHAGQVDRDRPVPAFGIVDVDLPFRIALILRAPEPVARIPAGIGEGDIAPAKSRDMAVERRCDLREIGNVAGGRARVESLASRSAPSASISASVTLAPASAMTSA
jgi:hypothetical protein